MPAQRPALQLVVTLTLLAAACKLPAANRDQLRVIVQEQCAPHWAQQHDPAPCRSVTTEAASPGSPGFAVLHDITGGAHYLLIPTGTLPGIESPELLDPATRNYFQAAWEARDALAGDAGRPVPDAGVALAINSALARTQDQLHIHISCQKVSVHDALSQWAERLGPDWQPIGLDSGTYQALRVMGRSLADADPFQLLASHLPDAGKNMGRYSLLVAAMNFREGPGFVVLAGTGVPGSAMILDPDCAIARGVVPGASGRSLSHRARK
jgi:CDP-diacylglycerol pyrophosphatase